MISMTVTLIIILVRFLPTATRSVSIYAQFPFLELLLANHGSTYGYENIDNYVPARPGTSVLFEVGDLPRSLPYSLHLKISPQVRIPPRMLIIKDLSFI